MMRRILFASVLLGLTAFAAMPADAACTSPAGNEGHSRYDFTAHALYICTGTVWADLVSAGGGALSSLSDTNITSPANNSLLRYDSGTSKWINVELQSGLGATTMVSGWPDAIRCYVTNPNWGWRTLYIQESPYILDTVTRYREPGNSNAQAYNADKTYSSAQSAGYTAHNCNVTIGALYTSGQAYNFVGGGSPWTKAGSFVHYMGGNVGIGTASATSLLHVMGAAPIVTIQDTNAGFFPKLSFLQSNGTERGYVAQNSGNMVYQANAGSPNGSHIFTSQIGEIMRIGYNGAGNVGIGTTSPLRNLHILSPAAEASIVLTRDDSLANNKNWRIFTQNAGASTASNLTFDLLNDAGSGVTRNVMNLLANGNVGIGVTGPIRRFQVSTTVDSEWAASVYNGGTTNGHGFFGQTASAGGVGVMGSNTNTGAYGYLGYGGWGMYCAGSTCGGTQVWTNTSDGRLKSDVQDLTNAEGLATILKMRPVSFDWIDAKERKIHGRQIGFIAQEVETVLPTLVSHSGTPTSIQLADGSKKTIDDTAVMSYATVVVPLVKAVQELKAENDNLLAELQAASEAFKALRRDVDELKAGR